MNHTASDALQFPDDFTWGCATSAFQIEGATEADGRGPSIWDEFCTRPGAITDGTTGNPATDHFHRMPEDVALVSSLNLNAYRFSIAWPRVVPNGAGPVNQTGLDFYDRLVDELLAANISPVATLYHWDLPLALQSEGGWTARDTAFRFAEYTEAVLERLGDRVDVWLTINEPFVAAHHGHISGEHAPGLTSRPAGLAVAHHLLLAHGLATERVRSVAPHAAVGIVCNFTPVVPVSDDPDDVAAARLVDDFENRWFVEPVAGLGYPVDAAERLGWDGSEVLDGDLDLISAPTDLLGVNYYTRQLRSADTEAVHEPRLPCTEMGWEISPPDLGGLLRTLHDRYGFSEYQITENGAAMADVGRGTGAQVADHDRIEYFAAHLAEVHAAIGDGVPITGYFAWSLLDNFEWALGNSKHFGIVEVDPVTLDRRPKASADWYAEVARTSTVTPTGR